MCSMDDMSGEFAGHGKTGTFSASRKCTDPCYMGPCIIMLKHEVRVAADWHDNGTLVLVTVSLCILFASD